MGVPLVKKGHEESRRFAACKKLRRLFLLESVQDRLAGCGNLPAASDEWHVVAVVEAEFALEGAVVFQFGVAIAGYLSAFVAALEVEMGTVVAERAIEAQLHGAELGLPTGLIELDVSGADHVDIVGAPSLDFGDPPTAEGVGRTRLGQAAVTRSLGRRIRLQATAVSVTTQPTRANPRCRVLRNPAAVLIQPNGSSVRFRRRWLIA